MQKNNYQDDILEFEWSDDLQDLNIPKPQQTGHLFKYRYQDIFDENDSQKLSQEQLRAQKNQKQRISSLSLQKMFTQMQQVKIQHRQSKSQNLQLYPQRVQQDVKCQRQKNYSKVYRQRMKQKYKQLQKQNQNLKNRIFELQSQLRQQQIQLNRFKFPAPQKQLSLQELNRQFADLSVDYIESLKQKPGQYQKKWFLDQSYFRKFFLDFYAQRGFAGRKKLKILNYHFNQFLQTVLKDSQKYLSLLYFSSENYNLLQPLPQFQMINKAYLEIYKSDGDLWHRLKNFNRFLKPMSQQLNMHISQFYKKYEDILRYCNKIHNFIKENYQENMDIGRRRLQMESWFDFHKDSKVMRKLRHKWFDWMKSLAQKGEQEDQFLKRTTKRKKRDQ